MPRSDEIEKLPKLTPAQIIEYCKDKLGLSFNIMDEERAKTFVEKQNYFFRLEQYLGICPEANKTKSGKYVGLDFGHLVEMSTIDMYLRKILFKLTIDLEHYLKVKLVSDCQDNPADDGYEAVAAFLEKNPKVRSSIQTGFKLIGYYERPMFRYTKAPAVWNFVEMLEFNDFSSFYSFYYEFFRSDGGWTKQFEAVRKLRNAAAHNSCILCSFKPVPGFVGDYETTLELIGGNIGINPGIISNMMRVPFLNDFAVLLSVYKKMATHPVVLENTLKEVMDFFDGRMIRHKDYFENFTEVKNAYRFARGVVEFYSRPKPHS
ncbi:MAG: Abi family protein [Spirochaetia bacterium]|nr:Abi family protein [Spirochaetia bacterium]